MANPPHDRILLAGCEILLLGTVQGFVPDAQRVRDVFISQKPEVVALGVPPEDIVTLDSIAQRAAAPDFEVEDENSLVDPDPMTKKFLEILKPFGETKVPSPDLQVAHELARAQSTQLVGIDLDDQTHASVYTTRVRFGHVMRSNTRNRKMLANGLGRGVRPTDAYAAAIAWDERANVTDSLRAVERERERAMANKLRMLALQYKRILAVVPVTRLAGVAAELRATKGAT